MKVTRYLCPICVLVVSLLFSNVARSQSTADRNAQLNQVDNALLNIEYLGVDAESRAVYLNELLQAVITAHFSGDTLVLVAETLRISDHLSGEDLTSMMDFVRQELQEARDELGSSEVHTVVRNGDIDGNGEIDLTDGINLIDFLFLGGEAPVPSGCKLPLSAPPQSYAPRYRNGDVNGDGTRDLTDFIRLVGWSFAGSEPPPVENVCDRVGS